MIYRVFMVLMVSLVLVACSKSTVVLLENDKSHNAILIANKNGETKLDKAGSYVDISRKEKNISEVKNMAKAEINSRFAQALAMIPEKPLKYVLYFKPNSTVLMDESEVIFKKVLKTIEKRSPCMVDVIGHTDTVGASAMNVKVSLKRAKTIEALVKESGVKVHSLVAKGYGEEDLLVPTKDNVDEAKNRNVEIFIK